MAVRLFTVAALNRLSLSLAGSCSDTRSVAASSQHYALASSSPAVSL